MSIFICATLYVIVCQTEKCQMLLELPYLQLPYLQNFHIYNYYIYGAQNMQADLPE